MSSCSSFSKPSLDIWNFLVCTMLKPSMQDFKHDLTSMGDECNCLMVNTFFGTNYPSWQLGWGSIFSSPMVFQICWHNECKSLMASSFRDLPSSAGISSHPLAFFNISASWAAEQSQFADLPQMDTWEWPPWGKHGLQGLTHLPRLLPPTVRFIPCHTLICVTDPFSFTQSLTFTFSYWVRLSVRYTLSIIFLHHSIMLCPSHIFSLTPYLS